MLRQAGADPMPGLSDLITRGNVLERVQMVGNWEELKLRA